MGVEKLEEMLVGAQLTLLNVDSIEHYSFGQGGSVAATLGLPGGPVCAPILRYRVTEDGNVELTSNGSIHCTWEQIELADEVLSVRSGSHLKRFKFTPAQKKKKRYLP